MAVEFETIKPKVQLGTFEIICILWILVYLINYLVGAESNKRKARNWFLSTAHCWTGFGLVGHEGKKVIEYSPHQFVFYAAQKQNFESLTGVIKLWPRQDLFKLIWNYFKGTKTSDSITFTAPVQCDGIVFAILQRNKSASIAKKRWDIVVIL